MLLFEYLFWKERYSIYLPCRLLFVCLFAIPFSPLSVEERLRKSHISGQTKLKRNYIPLKIIWEISHCCFLSITRYLLLWYKISRNSQSTLNNICLLNLKRNSHLETGYFTGIWKRRLDSTAESTCFICIAIIVFNGWNHLLMKCKDHLILKYPRPSACSVLICLRPSFLPSLPLLPLLLPPMISSHFPSFLYFFQ